MEDILDFTPLLEGGEIIIENEDGTKVIMKFNKEKQDWVIIDGN